MLIHSGHHVKPKKLYIGSSGISCPFRQNAFKRPARHSNTFRLPTPYPTHLACF